VHSKDCLGIVGECKDCGNPVLQYLCNDSLFEVKEESKHWDYWACCSNILCPNHYGQGVFQDYPIWMTENK
jgi:hypothetical protein